MSNFFERATREKWRFENFGTPLTVEDLWTLRLTAKDTINVPNLNDIAKALYKQLRSDEEVDFVNPDKKSDPTIQAKLDLVRHIIDTRLKERNETDQELIKNLRRQRLVADLRKAIEEF